MTNYNILAIAGRISHLRLHNNLTLDEAAFGGGSAFLFAGVLDVFFGLYANVNTFTQLKLMTLSRKGVWCSWPPRSGARPLL